VRGRIIFDLWKEARAFNAEAQRTRRKRKNAEREKY
jgi:hypothetical protein